MKRLLLIAFSITFLLASCKKLDIEKGVPKCVEKEIKRFDKSDVCNDARVDEYLFQNNLVYVFERGTCGADFSSAVYSKNCDDLGNLGGFSGNVFINGENFSNAKLERTVWEK